MRMCKLKSLLAMMALAGGAVFAFGADKDGQPETKVSRTVYGGDHDATVNFTNDIGADGQNHKTKAKIAAKAPLTETEVGGYDPEFRWKDPDQVETTKKVRHCFGVN